MVFECKWTIALYLQQILREYAVLYAGHVINRVEPFRRHAGKELSCVPLSSSIIYQVSLESGKL